MYFKILMVSLLLFECKSYAVTNKQYASVPEVFYFDNYDNCLLREDEALYCYVSYALDPVNKENPSEAWNIIRNLSANENHYRHDYLRHFICVPKSCPGVNKSDDSDPLFIKALEECYNEKLKEQHLRTTITEIHCETQHPKNPVDWIDIAGGIILVSYVLFTLYATCYEVIAGYKSPEDYQRLTNTPKGKVLSAFSITKNWIRLKTVKDTPEVAKFRGIQAIRFYNSAVVVLSHSLLGFLVAPIANTRFTETMLERGSSVFFGGAHLCMSAFFLISSFLLSKGLFEYMNDKKRLNVKTILKIFLYRYLRLMPSVAFVILFYATWLRHLGRGPLWNISVEREYTNCRKNGWTNFLFINNLVNSDNMCFPTSWYLALSMQYFIMSLFFIWFLKTHEKYVWYILGAAISINISGTFVQNYYYDFSALMISTAEGYFGLKNFLKSPQFQTQIGSFIGNMSGEITGIAFGYFFYKRQLENPNEKLFETKVSHFMFWALIALAPLCVIVPGVIILYYSNVHSAFWASVYVALSRPLLSLALGTLLLGLAEGVGWVLLRVCHWPPVYVLGRLTYSVYLVHTIIVSIRPALSRYPTYLSDYTCIHRFFGDIMITYIAATILTLLVELPVTALQKIAFVQMEDEKETQENNKID